jgi:organic radical activating enzyme
MSSRSRPPATDVIKNDQWSVREAAEMSYNVHEIYATLQGEGLNTGRRAVFCRFAGCNLWNGREADRATVEDSQTPVGSRPRSPVAGRKIQRPDASS